MKELTRTTKGLFAALSIMGITSVAFAASNSTHDSEAIAATKAKISLSQAMGIAAQKAQGQIISAKFDDDKDGIYEVKIADGQTNHEVKINATTGNVIKIKQEKLEQDDMAEFGAFRQAKVNLTQALQQAGQTVGGQAIGGEFDLKNGNALYKIKVVKGAQVYDVKVDAGTGSILSNQLDSPDHDDSDEHKQNL